MNSSKCNCRVLLSIVLGSSLVCTSSSVYSYRIFNERVNLLISKAKAGNKRAQYKLGVAYLTGTTVKMNKKKGLYWIKKSASQKYHKAWFRLGEMHYDKKYRMRNYRKSFRWFLKAAKADHGVSQYYVALHYLKGRGVARRGSSALIWAARAKRNGVADAGNLLKEIHVKIVRDLNAAKLRKKRRALAKKKKQAKAKLKRVAQAKARRAERARAIADANAKTIILAEAQAIADAQVLEYSQPIVKETEITNINDRALSVIKSKPLNVSKASIEASPRALISSREWVQNGEPSYFVPSSNNECVQNHNKIKCTSKRIREKRDNHIAHFRYISKISNISAKGDFKISYRKYYLLVLPDNSGEEAIPETGMGNEVFKLKCRIQNVSQIHCVKPNSTVVLMSTK